jgi:hypothetical protein
MHESLHADQPTNREQKTFHLYLQLASECFVKATAAPSDSAELLKQMGNCYLAHAATLKLSGNSARLHLTIGNIGA